MTTDFAKELARFGPDSGQRPMRRADAQSYCSRLARTHYENFTVASLLLPRRLLKHFHNVYAYCRWSDDLADETGGGPEALKLLRWWRGELLKCFEGGELRHPVMISLRETITRFQIPQQPFLDLLFAFEQDQIVTRYSTFEQLLRYCQCSANPVGRLVLYLFECHNEENAYLSDHVCTGLQLANFWQDVSRDLDIGRIYVPQEDQEHFGYGEDDFQRRRWCREFQNLMAFEVERARDLFYRGYPLVDRVPTEFQCDIELFIQGGLTVLRQIEHQDYHVWERRPVVPKWRKAWLLLRAIGRRIYVSTC